MDQIVQTLSVLCGTKACNAKCPFCVSKMTPEGGVGYKKDCLVVNWRNFDIACRYAKAKGATTLMITSKGEPLLYPELITEYLLRIKDSNLFPLVELQTNGLLLSQEYESKIIDEVLKSWYDNGLTTIAISVVHYDAEENQKIYTPNRRYPDIQNTIRLLHSIGFSVRLSCMMLNEFIDSYDEIDNIIFFAKDNKVEQLTLTPINKPIKTENEEITNWTNSRLITEKQFKHLIEHIEDCGTYLTSLVHGAKVFDYDGQNVCLNNCLQPHKDGGIRNVIFFPDGHIRYDWQHMGAIIL